jgi:hypothetical protein
MLMVMSNTILTTNKPWVLLVFVLAFAGTLVALTSAFGIAGNPLNNYVAPPASGLVTSSVATASVSAGFSAAAILLLALDVIILYGLSQGHVWAWYLLLFTVAASVVFTVIGAVTGEAFTTVSIIALIVNVVMLAALLHRQVIKEYNVDLKIIPSDGVWGTA